MTIRTDRSHRVARLATQCLLLCVLLAPGACSPENGSEDGDGSALVSAAEGGEVTSADGRVTLTVPAGALAEDAEIRILAVDPTDLPPAVQDLALVSPAYKLLPAGLAFATPVTVRVVAGEATLSAADGTVTMRATTWFTWSDPGGIDPLGGVNEDGAPEQVLSVDPETGVTTVTGNLEHFSWLYGVKGGLEWILEEVPSPQEVGTEFSSALKVRNRHPAADEISYEGLACAASTLGDIIEVSPTQLQFVDGELGPEDGSWFDGTLTFRCPETPGAGDYGFGFHADIQFPTDLEPEPMGPDSPDYHHIDGEVVEYFGSAWHVSARAYLPMVCEERGACCVMGECTDTFESECLSLEGQFHPGESCADFECEDPLGACCTVGEGWCSDVTEAECEEKPGLNEWHHQTTCSELYCPILYGSGACCFVEGDCLEYTEEECYQEDGWRWFKDGDCDDYNCDPFQLKPCCCDEIGVCFVTMMQRCWDGDCVPHEAAESCDQVVGCAPGCAGETVNMTGAVHAAELAAAAEFTEVVNAMICALDTIIFHSSGESSKEGAGDHTQSVAKGALAVAAVTADTLLEAFGNTHFPCGPGDLGFTLCPPSPGIMPAGDYVVVYNVLHGDLPLGDPARFFQYGFVFDADGDPGNNNEPAPAFPKDFFQGTDRWYMAGYDPATGWALQVVDASGDAPADVTDSSDARIIITGDTITLVVPAVEFQVPDPSYRVTAFSHGGDWGMNPPHDWSGDVEPTVEQGLETL